MNPYREGISQRTSIRLRSREGNIEAAVERWDEDDEVWETVDAFTVDGDEFTIEGYGILAHDLGPTCYRDELGQSDHHFDYENDSGKRPLVREIAQLLKDQ